MAVLGWPRLEGRDNDVYVFFLHSVVKLWKKSVGVLAVFIIY